MPHTKANVQVPFSVHVLAHHPLQFTSPHLRPFMNTHHLARFTSLLQFMNTERLGPFTSLHPKPQPHPKPAHHSHVDELVFTCIANVGMLDDGDNLHTELFVFLFRRKLFISGV